MPYNTNVEEEKGCRQETKENMAPLMQNFLEIGDKTMGARVQHEDEVGQDYHVFDESGINY